MTEVAERTEAGVPQPPSVTILTIVLLKVTYTSISSSKDARLNSVPVQMLHVGVGEEYN